MEFVLPDPLVAIPMPAPPDIDDDVTLGTLAWGRNVPVIEDRDGRLCGQVVNLSGLPLTCHQTELLQLGLRFQTAPKSIPRLKLMAGIEGAFADLRRVSQEDSVWFRSESARILHKARPIKPNLSKDLKQAAKQLNQDQNIVITSADKGGRTVVLLADHYAELCSTHLEDPAYSRVESFGTGRFKVSTIDPITGRDKQVLNDSFQFPDLMDNLMKFQCTRLITLLKKLVAAHDLNAEDLRSLSPQHPYSGVFPRFYGLPKIHKLGRLRIRPIISNWGLYSDGAAKHMKGVLNLLPTYTTSVRHSYQLVEILDNFDFPDSAFLVSFDVQSLFTRVPVKETLKIVERRLKDLWDTNIELFQQTTSLTVEGTMQLLTFLLNDAYFIWSERLYRQSEGLPMGSRLSPVLACIYMEDLEEAALSQCPVRPLLYKRYVDDVVIVWDRLFGSYTVLLEILNQQHPNIIMTAEEELNGRLPFLDVMITRPDTVVGRQYSLAVYRKETHSDRYIHFKSSHPFSIKKNVFRGLLLRAHRILRNHPESLRVEVAHLIRAFTSPFNAYPEVVIRRWHRAFVRDLENKPTMLNLPALTTASMLGNTGDREDPTDSQETATQAPATQASDRAPATVRTPWVPTLFGPYVPTVSERL